MHHPAGGGALATQGWILLLLLLLLHTHTHTHTRTAGGRALASQKQVFTEGAKLVHATHASSAVSSF